MDKIKEPCDNFKPYHEKEYNHICESCGFFQGAHIPIPDPSEFWKIPVISHEVFDFKNWNHDFRTETIRR